MDSDTSQRTDTSHFIKKEKDSFLSKWENVKLDISSYETGGNVCALKNASLK